MRVKIHHNPNSCIEAIMQYFLISIMLMLMANSAFASGLSEPKVLQPVLGVTASCDQEFTATRLDYIGATAHFIHAIGQSKSTAEQSAKNMVAAHVTARKQTCNAKAKAVTDENGNSIPDGLSGILVNLAKD